MQSYKILLLLFSVFNRAKAITPDEITDFFENPIEIDFSIDHESTTMESFELIKRNIDRIDDIKNQIASFDSQKSLEQKEYIKIFSEYWKQEDNSGLLGIIFLNIRNKNSLQNYQKEKIKLENCIARHQEALQRLFIQHEISEKKFELLKEVFASCYESNDIHLFLSIAEQIPMVRSITAEQLGLNQTAFKLMETEYEINFLSYKIDLNNQILEAVNKMIFEKAILSFKEQSLRRCKNLLKGYVYEKINEQSNQRKLLQNLHIKKDILLEIDNKLHDNFTEFELVFLIHTLNDHEMVKEKKQHQYEFDEINANLSMSKNSEEILDKIIDEGTKIVRQKTLTFVR